MIQIDLSIDYFQYDIYTLVQAFFPGEEIKVTFQEGIPKDFKGIFLETLYTESGVSFLLKNSECEDFWKKDVSWDNDDRKWRKRQMKICLYHMLSEYTRKILPWGNLTGIRPVKIVMNILEQGKTEEEVRKELREIYCMTEEKIDLAMEIAKAELAKLAEFDYPTGYSLYVGIPFCPTTCLYCSFTSYPIIRWKERTGEYLQALFEELTYISKKMKNVRLDSIYIGGGTPTTLEAEQLKELIGFIREKFDCSYVKEFCVEAGRPDSITKEKLIALNESGIDRISINPQSMNDETLKIIGRQHSVEDIRKAFYLAREVGFSTINMDVILGLPGENVEHIKKTMEEIKKLSPENLTVHTLALKRAARLKLHIDDYESDINSAPEDMMKIAAQAAKSMGMKPYYLYRQKNMGGNLENVGYTKDGHTGLYNILIMEEKQTIVAAGAGASTKFLVEEGQIHRVENVKDVSNYMERIHEMIDRKEEVLKEYDSQICGGLC